MVLNLALVYSILCTTTYNQYFLTHTSRDKDGLTAGSSSYVSSIDSDSVDSGTLQLVYGVASASETATGALSSSVSLSPHHLPTGH